MRRHEYDPVYRLALQATGVVLAAAVLFRIVVWLLSLVGVIIPL